jgi:hypothetical protein
MPWERRQWTDAIFEVNQCFPASSQHNAMRTCERSEEEKKKRRSRLALVDLDQTQEREPKAASKRRCRPSSWRNHPTKVDHSALSPTTVRVESPRSARQTARQASGGRRQMDWRNRGLAECSSFTHETRHGTRSHHAPPPAAGACCSSPPTVVPRLPPLPPRTVGRDEHKRRSAAGRS